ncbi:hypothetical protein, partial [Paramuribaculum intestinale]|uniref:hypothetical protein n=1 Tax=Paramuribaculum intestinale TaxID=2094151 RepID=UPI0025B74908
SLALTVFLKDFRFFFRIQMHSLEFLGVYDEIILVLPCAVQAFRLTKVVLIFQSAKTFVG